MNYAPILTEIELRSEITKLRSALRAEKAYNKSLATENNKLKETITRLKKTVENLNAFQLEKI